MNIFAWTGVALAAFVLVSWFFFSGVMGLCTSSVGKALLVAWTLLGLVAWGIVGGIYLIVAEVTG